MKERMQKRLQIGTGWQQHIVSYAFGEELLVVVGSLKDLTFYSTEKSRFEEVAKSTVLTQPTSVWYLPKHAMFVTCDC